MNLNIRKAHKMDLKPEIWISSTSHIKTFDVAETNQSLKKNTLDFTMHPMIFHL